MTDAFCPTCSTGSPRTSHSGGFVDLVKESIPGARTLWAVSDGSYPEADLTRCAACSQVWLVEHRYPDRPPYYVTLSPLSEQDVAAALAGTCEAFLELALRRGQYVQFDGLLVAVALRADAATQRAIRSHPDLPARLAESWDRRVRAGSRLVAAR
ncbi:MAG: hypothetical protein KC912_08885 [Proteobacteria bacterium]|nr:hypothetical protein [Pseudomonadota bacterium]